MSILVFGKTGQVARELQHQAQVIALGREDADLSDPQRCAEIVKEINPDFVINAAAYTAVDAAETDEELATIVNASAPGAIAKAAADLAIPFLHISTDYVFDGRPGSAWKPDDTANPIGAYGRSKLAGEIAVRDAGGHYVILRTSWVFSAFGNNFVKTMLRLGRERDQLNVVSDQIGGPTPAAGIAAALLNIAQQIQNGNSCSGIYHFSGDPAVSWADFAREIFNQAGLETRVADIPGTEFPTPARRPANSVMNCEVLLQDFHISQPNWKQALVHVIEELKE